MAQITKITHGAMPMAAPLRLGKGPSTSPLHTRRSFTRVTPPRRVTIASAVAAAAAAPAEESPLAALAAAATNMFPLFVLGAAVLGLINPNSFDWFHPSFMTPALGVTMLGMGLTLSFEVRHLA